MNEEKSNESVEVSEQCQGVKAEISQRDVEIRELNQSIQATISENQSIERECESLKMGCNEQQEIRSRQQATIYQNNGALSKWEQECFAQ